MNMFTVLVCFMTKLHHKYVFLKSLWESNRALVYNVECFVERAKHNFFAVPDPLS